MDRFRVVFQWSFVLVALFAMLDLQASAEYLYNSTLACTRGANQTIFDVDCRNGIPHGLVGRLYFTNIYYGTPPLTSGCSRTAPYSSCCTQRPDVDCVFKRDTDLEEIAKKFTGSYSASFNGMRISSNGYCDPNTYPDLTSYSILEYGCAGVGELNDITGKNVHFTSTGQVYLDSNGFFNNSDVKDDSFQCLIQTSCNSTLTFYALLLQRKMDSKNQCPETLTFADVKYSDINSSLSCNDSDLIFNRQLFASFSNAAIFNMTVAGVHTGKVFMQVKSSNETSMIDLTCGSEIRTAIDNLQRCPEDPTTTSEGNAVTFPTTTAQETQKSTAGFITYIIHDPALSAGVIAGIVLGVVAIILMIALIIGFVIYKYRKNRNDSPPPYIDPISSTSSTNEVLNSSKKNIYDILGSTGGSQETAYGYDNLEQQSQVDDDGYCRLQTENPAPDMKYIANPAYTEFDKKNINTN